MRGATEHHPIHRDLAGVLASIRQSERREEESLSYFRDHSVISRSPPLVGTDRTTGSMHAVTSESQERECTQNGSKLEI